MSKTIKCRLNNINKYIQRKWEEYYWNFICKYSHKVDWKNISSNPNITIEIIGNNPDKPWDWVFISANPNITMEIIDNSPDKPWDWWNISQKSNITMEIIENNPDKPWDWNLISINPNITMEFIEKYSDKPWNWTGISINQFTKEKELFYQKYYRIYFATFRLQQYFNRMYDNPDYLFCRKRLEKMFP